jgi:flagellar biosynthesis GTPase FlhF
MDPKVLQQLQDTLTVTIGIQDRHARMIVDHEEWLEEQTRAIARHERWMKQHEESMQEQEATMQKIEHNLQQLSELILRSRGGGNGDGAVTP